MEILRGCCGVGRVLILRSELIPRSDEVQCSALRRAHEASGLGYDFRWMLGSSEESAKMIERSTGELDSCESGIDILARRAFRTPPGTFCTPSKSPADLSADNR